MLQLLLAVAFSAVPLTLYVPPVRKLTLFIQAMEKIVRETEAIVTGRYYRRLRLAYIRILDCILPSST